MEPCHHFSMSPPSAPCIQVHTFFHLCWWFTTCMYTHLLCRCAWSDSVEAPSYIDQVMEGGRAFAELPVLAVPYACCAAGAVTAICLFEADPQDNHTLRAKALCLQCNHLPLGLDHTHWASAGAEHTSLACPFHQWLASQQMML